MRQSLEEAAYDYAKEKTKFRKDVLKEVDADNYVSRHADCMGDFEAGAQWKSKQSPWISVNDSLPANMQRVLVRSEYEGESLFEVAFIMNGKWMCHNPTPTHWMPIPEFNK